jgi:hypothetical protein
LRTKRRLPQGDDLGIDWEQWADGRAHRLKRGKDYGDLKNEIIREAARNAAKRMGKVVKITADRYSPDKYNWFQFADFKVKIGNPCRCGSLTVHRLHTHFGRCPECKAQIILTKVEEDDDEDKEPRPVRILRGLTDVHLALRERTDDFETYRGWGHDPDDAPVLLLAQFRIDVEDDRELDPELVFDRLDSIQVFPFEQLTDLFDPSSIRNGTGSGWDLVVNG